MKLYLLERTDSWRYDEYDSWIVAAPNANVAKTIGPLGLGKAGYSLVVTVTYLGDAKPGTPMSTIHTSFNAG